MQMREDAEQEAAGKKPGLEQEEAVAVSKDPAAFGTSGAPRWGRIQEHRRHWEENHGNNTQQLSER